MLIGVTSDSIESVWSVVSPMLERAVEKSPKDMTTDDILVSLKSKDMQLWVWVVEGVIKACCVTQILVRPRHTICSIPYIAGSGLREWIFEEPKLVEWAKWRGCDQFEGYCRDGWIRVLKNWKKVFNTMRRDI